MTNTDETSAERSPGSAADYADGMLAFDRFVRPALRQALEQIDARLGTDGPPRILDAGCGPGGVFPLFPEVFGDSTAVLAVDNSEPHLTVAREQIQDHDLEDTVSLDRHDLASDIPAEWGSFDVCWFSNVLFFFDDPVAMLERFRERLRPGGVVAAFYGGWDRATFLPGHPQLDALSYQSRMADLDRCPTDWREREGANHPERMPTWLTDAGFAEVTHEVLPVTYERDASGGLEHHARAYLEQRLSESVRESVRDHGSTAGLSVADRDQVSRLVDPTSDEYVLDQPGYYCHVPTLLTTALAPTANDD